MGWKSEGVKPSKHVWISCLSLVPPCRAKQEAASTGVFLSYKYKACAFQQQDLQQCQVSLQARHCKARRSKRSQGWRKPRRLKGWPFCLPMGAASPYPAPDQQQTEAQVLGTDREWDLRAGENTHRRPMGHNLLGPLRSTSIFFKTRVGGFWGPD